jgi:hypothetical protein
MAPQSGTVRAVADADYWSGGPVYELAVELAPVSREQAVGAFDGLWLHPALDGPYREPVLTAEPHLRGVEELSDERCAGFGLATLWSGLTLPVHAFVVELEESAFWLDLNLRPRALELLDPEFITRGDHLTEPDQERLESWLADVALHLFNVMPFRRALVGVEVPVYAEDVTNHAHLIPYNEEKPELGLLFHRSPRWLRNES